MNGVNRVILFGNLGADPELRFGQSGPESAVLRLRLATTESYLDKRTNERKERTDWHNVVVFGRRGEALQRILAKGSTVLIEGRLQTSSYEKDGQKHYSTNVVASNVCLAGGGNGARANGGYEQGNGNARPVGNANGYGNGGGGGGRRAPADPMNAPDPDPFSGGGYGDDDIPFATSRGDR